MRRASAGRIPIEIERDGSSGITDGTARVLNFGIVVARGATPADAVGPR
jgi:hypothetical protein